MRISNVSFQGIKVTKQQQNISVPRETRSEQRRILASCYKELDLLEECANSIGLDVTVDEDSFTFNSSPQISDILTNSKKEYKQKREELSQKTTIFDKKMPYTERMIQAVRDAITEIAKADKKETENLFNSSSYSYAIPNNTGLESIAGYKDELEVIQKEFIDRVNAEKQGQDVDIFGSILFFGPYGNGKTHITEAVAKATDCVIKPILVGKDSQKAMDKIMKLAKGSEERFKKDRTRTVIFIDEADNLIGKNSTVSEEFEEFIKDCSKKYHCSVFAATNNPLNLSVNLSDPDVFPIKMSIDPPNEDNMEEVFKYYLQDKAVEDIDYKKIVKVAKEREKETDSKYNTSQIVEICKNLHYKKKCEKITEDDITAEISSIEPFITPGLNSKFENDYKELIEG